MRQALAELLGSPDLVARSAEAANVAVVVRSPLRKRNDMIGYGGWRDDALSSAVSAERFVVEASLALGYTTAATEAVGLMLTIAMPTLEWLWQSARLGAVELGADVL